MRLNVFIADEYDLVRQGIRAVIEDQPDWIVCGEAATCGETIDEVRRLQPDLLLLDVTLSDIDTAKAIEEIRRACPRVKIVALALPAAGEPAARALAAGASGLAMISDAADVFLATLHNIGNSKPSLSFAAVAMLQTLLSNGATPAARPDDLTKRELGVLKLLATGCTNKEVAVSLELSVKTIDVHRTNIMRKLKLATYSDLIQFAIRHRLLRI